MRAHVVRGTTNRVCLGAWQLTSRAATGSVPASIIGYAPLGRGMLKRGGRLASHGARERRQPARSGKTIEAPRQEKGLRLLLVEDSDADADLVLRVLTRDRLHPSVTRVETREAFKSALDREPWDIIISDHTLPGYSG